MACCRCCEKVGACCTDEGCTETTCSECEDLGGKFQGVDTECVGDSEDECPCEPPADPAECQKCVDALVTFYCTTEKPNCCDGRCQTPPCPDPCPGQCEWEVVWGEGDAYEWSQVAGCPEPGCLCAEPDVESVGSQEFPAQEGNYFTPCVECLSDEDCEGGYCCSGVCQEEECLECICDLECCMVIQGRNTCEPGSTWSPPAAGEGWGVSGDVAGWFEYGPENEQQQGDAWSITAEYLGCVDGVHRVNVTSLADSIAIGSIAHYWYDVVITLEDGCPSSVELGEPDEVICEDFGCGDTTPRAPAITFICNEAPLDEY